MTAEIAIVNRAAVTLAADSAVTLSVRGARKIYSSTDKIFELSEKDPIGLMIYNNLEFMGAPLDVLVKHFRTSPHCCTFDEMQAASDAFFQYLMKEWMPSEEMQQRHALRLLRPVFRKVRNKFDQAVRQLLTGSKTGNVPGRRIYAIFQRCVSEEIATYEVKHPAECFEHTSEDEISAFYGDAINGLIDSVFPSEALSDQDKALLLRLGVLALHRDVFSEALSGLVFAGFGRQEVFPSLLGFHIDGIIANKLKKKKTDEERTGRESIYAKILPFAQREVVDRFLVGIDPELETGISNYLASAKVKTTDNLFEGITGISAKVKRQITANVEKSLGAAVLGFRSGWLTPIKERYQQQTEDMVLFMAKPELAHLAEALVNITSLKRKFSADEETVAGPIDVAVISKSDGFVWVKRKHYFPRELNARYFMRKSGIVTTPDEGAPDNATT
jgi:hypothetical protein